MARVSLRANPAFDAAAPLSQARVTVRLPDGRRALAGRRRRARLPGTSDRRRAGDEVHGVRRRHADGGRRSPPAWTALQDFGRSDQRARPHRALLHAVDTWPRAAAGRHRRRHRTGGGRPVRHPPAGRPRRARHQDRTAGRRRLRARLRRHRQGARELVRVAEPHQGVGDARPQAARSGRHPRSTPARRRRVPAEPGTRAPPIALGSPPRRCAPAIRV